MQFAPVYDGGAKMKDGAEVPLERTATPVELDQVYGALDELSAALGPNGANKNGALSDLVDVGAANLEGNGAALNRTLTGFSQAVQTLADAPRRPVRVAGQPADVHVRAGQHRRAGAAVQQQHGRRRPTCSPAERQDLASAIQLLNKALADVAGFVQDNTTLLTTNVEPARRRHRSRWCSSGRPSAEVLDVAPAALGNLAHAYNPDYGTLDTRDNGLGLAQRRGRRLQCLAAARPGDLRPTCRCRPDGDARAAADDAGGHLRPAAVRRRERRRSPTTSTATACPTSRSC